MREIHASFNDVENYRQYLLTPSFGSSCVRRNGEEFQKSLVVLVKMMNVDSCDRRVELCRRLVIANGWPTDDDNDDDDDDDDDWSADLPMTQNMHIERDTHACLYMSFVSTCVRLSSSFVVRSFICHLLVGMMILIDGRTDETSHHVSTNEPSSDHLSSIVRSFYVVITIFWQAESSQAAGEWFIDERWRWWCETWPISTSDRLRRTKEM